MSDFFQFNPSLLTGSTVLVAMGCASLILFLILRWKLRVVQKLSKDLSVSIFSKTFNVFNPHIEHRKIIGNYFVLVILFVIYGYFSLLVVFAMKVLELGLLTSLITFLICLGLMMPSETRNIHRNLSIFEKSIGKGADLGKGDLDVLHFIKQILPKLSNYYLLLATLFFVSSLVFPYVTHVSLTAFAQLIGGAFALASSTIIIPLLTPFLTAFLFVTATVAIMFALGLAKSSIFGLPSAERIDVAGMQFHRMKMFVRIMHHHPTLQLPEPEEPEQADELDFDTAE
jgi:hypothetical protein